MPEYVMQDRKPVRKVIVSFSSLADVAAFADLLGQTVTPATKGITFRTQREKFHSFSYVDPADAP